MAARDPMRAIMIPAMAGAFKDDLAAMADAAEVGVDDDDEGDELLGFV